MVRNAKNVLLMPSDSEHTGLFQSAFGRGCGVFNDRQVGSDSKRLHGDAQSEETGLKQRFS